MSLTFWISFFVGGILFLGFIFIAERLTHKFVNFLLYGNKKGEQN